MKKNNLKNNQIFLREKNNQILKSRNMFKLCHLYTYSFNKREWVTLLYSFFCLL